MVRIDRVVTRGGDKGETSLGDGTRVSKADPRIEALGAVDEANASIGVLRIHTRNRGTEDAMLARVQNDLFDIGADLCVPGTGEDRLRITDAAVARLEAEVGAPAILPTRLDRDAAGAAERDLDGRERKIGRHRHHDGSGLAVVAGVDWRRALLDGGVEIPVLFPEPVQLGAQRGLVLVVLRLGHLALLHPSRFVTGWRVWKR